jgi:anti-sigma factor RsiW
MKRPICEDDLLAFADGALDEERKTEVEAYLASNEEAMNRVLTYRNQSAALRRSLEHVAREPIPSRLNIRNIVEGRSQRRSFSSWHVAAAATVFLAIGVTGGWISRDLTSEPSAGVGALAMEASASYRAFANDFVRPVEVRPGYPNELATLASSIIGASAKVPDLSASGYRLMGGRVIPTTHGPGFMWMYDDDHGTRLVMMTRRMEVDKDSRMREAASGEVSAWTWSHAGIGYSMVGAKSASDLKVIADTAKAQVLPI